MVAMNAEVIASLTTAAGTLVLAVATFASTRSANKASRFAETSLLAGLRPVLMHAQLNDAEQKVGFSDDHWVRLKGPEAAFQPGDDAVYLALALRNVGPGMAVLQGWYPTPARVTTADGPHPPVEDFRRQVRDLYIPAGNIGFWQGAFRDHSDPQFDHGRPALLGHARRAAHHYAIRATADR
jgi:hypothetical protein